MGSIPAEIKNPSPESIADSVRDGVTVVYACAVLDGIFGAAGWCRMDPEVWDLEMKAWVRAHDAFYYAWEGPSYMGLAEKDTAVRKTLAAGKKVVLIEPLS